MSTSRTRESWLRSQGKRAARSLSRRMRDFGQVEPEGFDLSNVPSADIALYFPDGPPKIYQLTQWLPVFENQPDLTTIVIVRQVEAYDQLMGNTTLKIILVPRYENLMALLDRADFRAVIYVNNGWTNFQALSFQRAVHIHVNHGESDKICMVSNQAKAYDKVFVAGAAAIERHRAALAWFDDTHLVTVGRPQLDLAIPPALPTTERTTITYAPTWEGEDEANNYSSVDMYGVKIITAALAQPNVRVIYKPHPRVSDSENSTIRQQHQVIVNLLGEAARREPQAGHAVLESTDMLAVIRSTDVLVADVSSVTLDFLYLRPGAPIVLTDRRTNRPALLSESPVASVCHIVDTTTIDSLTGDFAEVMKDSDVSDFHTIRQHYFGDMQPGESTTRFWSELTRAINKHDEALRSLSRIRTVAGESS